MKHYLTIEVNKRTHVICISKRDVSPEIPEPNYMDTGMALCGVVDKGDTLDDWIRKHNK